MSPFFRIQSKQCLCYTTNGTSHLFSLYFRKKKLFLTRKRKKHKRQINGKAVDRFMQYMLEDQDFLKN
jgi:hypothetical protein